MPETTLGGIGQSVRRKEDPRFIRGKGTYVDDVKLPGMLFGALVRSPYAHARIRKLDTAAAAKAAGVKLPKGVGYSPDSDEMEDYDDEDNLEAGRQVGVLARLAKCDQVALVKTLIAERLPTALTDIVEHGTDSAGAQVIRWFLDSDTLWLLEETDEGRDELIESVKKSPVVAKALGDRGRHLRGAQSLDGGRIAGRHHHHGAP